MKMKQNKVKKAPQMDMNQPLLTNKPMLNVTATPPTVLI